MSLRMEKIRRGNKEPLKTLLGSDVISGVLYGNHLLVAVDRES